MTREPQICLSSADPVSMLAVERNTAFSTRYALGELAVTGYYDLAVDGELTDQYVVASREDWHGELVFSECFMPRTQSLEG